MLKSMTAAEFELVPVKLSDGDDVSDPELASIQGLYDRCWMMVFGEDERPDYLGKVAAAETRIKHNATESGCSLEMFVLSNMMAHKETAPERRFNSSMLIGKYSVKRADRFRGACHKLYGVFDAESMGDLLGTYGSNEMVEIMLNSEIIAGSHVVGWRATRSGPPLKSLYEMHEIGLDPAWLAIEPSYYDLVLREHRERPSGTTEQRRHRYRVAKMIGELKRNKKKAVAAFRCRQDVMPKAVSRVLSVVGFSARSFEVEDRPVTDAMEFWSKLGTAVQHYRCILAVNGDEDIFRTMIR